MAGGSKDKEAKDKEEYSKSEQDRSLVLNVNGDTDIVERSDDIQDLLMGMGIKVDGKDVA